MKGLRKALGSWRIRLAVVLALLASLLVGLELRLRSQERLRHQTTREQALAAVTARLAGQLDALIGLREGELKVLAASAFIPRTKAARARLARRILDGSPTLRAVCLFDAAGRMLALAARPEERCPPFTGGTRLVRRGGLVRHVVAAELPGGGKLIGAYPADVLAGWLEQASSAHLPLQARLLASDGQPLLPAGAPSLEDGPRTSSHPVGERPYVLRAKLPPLAPNAPPTSRAWTAVLAVLLLSTGLGLAAWHLAREQMLELVEETREIGRTGFTGRVEERGPPEVRALAREVNTLVDELLRLYAETRTRASLGSDDLLMAFEVLAREQAAELSRKNEALELQADELRHHEEVLAQQNRELSDKNLQLERASRLKSEFLANMSHELRTPLNAVIGFSELMLEGIAGELTDEQADCTGDIFRAGRHLLCMINDLLDLAKVEAGKMEVQQVEVDLVTSVREAEDMARPLAARKELTLTVVAEGQVRCLGDGQRLTQVALNLLSNAVKFTPVGGSVRAEVRALADGRAELEVSDSGIGIDPAYHGLVFEAFRQVDGSAAREHAGTGLGLALVRRFVDAMGGSVALTSELGKGARFTVRLPAVAGSKAEAAA